MPQILLADTQSLINDALFRAGEIPGSSEWDEKALDYINRQYRMICTGASEFLPEYVADWWWMRAIGILTILPVFNTGTVSVTEGYGSAVLSSPPVYSLAGYRFKTEEHPDVFNIATNAAGDPNITFDSVYTGPTNLGATFKAMKTNYALDSAVAAIHSPISSFRDNPNISGMTPETMDKLYPTSQLSTGVPQAFALENEQTIRFSHGGRTDGRSMRMEYRYRPLVDDLSNSSSSYPLIPINYRHVLADMTLFYIFSDKNDDRLTVLGTGIRSLLGAMHLENRRRIVKIDSLVGKIQPRQSGLGRNVNRLLRTESGLIIG